MKQELRLILVPTLICVAAGLALSIVHQLTAERIRGVGAARRREAIAAVLPPGGEPPVAVVFRDAETGATNAVFHVSAAPGGGFAGAATEVVTPDGYAGEIRLMVGFNAFEELQAIAILDHRETPGLGARIAGTDYKATFPGRSLYSTRWALKRDGGDLDAITAATVSSRAVADAVAEAVARYIAYKDRLAAPSEPPMTYDDLLDVDLEALLDEAD